MGYWALGILAVILTAAGLGFSGVASTSAGLAELLIFFILLVLAISILAGLFRRAP